MGAITPPPIRVRVHRAPTPLSNGSQMDFTLWFGFIPIHWSARIEEVSETGFSDRLLSGPFAEWVHRHGFDRIDDETTQVTDQVTLKLKKHLLWGAVGLGFMLGLPVLFAYRGWKTRRLLEQGNR